MESVRHGGVMRLPPGFRFHPTDEELVVQYLRRKVFSCPLPAAVIPEIDLGKYDPWDLPTGVSEGEGYFFTLREEKYSKGSRCNIIRVASSGYWKATGKDKAIHGSRGNQLVGMKKAFVFHRGKPPHGSRTDWIMHEYRLAVPVARGLAISQKENATNSCMVQARDYVACRIFKKYRATKSGSGEIRPCYNDSRIFAADRNLFAHNMTRRGNHMLPSSSSSSSPSSSSCVTDISDDADSSSN